ncbi:MAG: DUF2142 domain-containing protein [Bacteroidota bacterium]|nr:DUF2142 domain-containing protein [Bacteroidota bacterium]
MNKRLSPHKTILCITIVFGLSLIVLTPPFQVPDEINHFYRAWQVSTGTFSSVKQNQRLGGYIPKSLDKLSSEFRPFTLNPYNRMSPKQVWQTRLIALDPDDTAFKDFTNTALYSAFLYLPQASGIFLGKQFGANPFWLIYLGRLSNLLIFTILAYYAIKIVPFKKWLFVLLISLPMSLSIHSSLSADMLLNALSYLMIAIALNLSFNENIQQISRKYIAAIFIISVLFGLAKLIYVPILFLLVLIPSRKFISSKVKIGFLVTIICAGIGTAVIQKSVIDSKYIPYSEYNEAYRDQTMLKKGVDINKQIEFIIENPKTTVLVFVKSFFKEFRNMTRGYIGILGWADIYLPSWFIYMAYLFIFIIVMFDFENNNIPGFTLFQRCYFGLLVFGLLVLIMLSQYLSWDMVGEGRVYPLQGRYFIPLFPLFFLMLFNVLKIKTGFFVPNTLAKGVLVFCILSGTISVYSVVAKSYILHDYSLTKWKINYSFKENRNDTTSNRVDYVIYDYDTIAALDRPIRSFISDEKVFTGTHSLKLSRNNPYGFTLRVFKGLANEKIVVSCRSYGYGGCLVVHEYPDGIYYQSGKTYAQKDSLGWKYKEVQFILTQNISESITLGIFAWYPDNDSIYIDDFRVTYFGKTDNY